jgi:hypothetical protein
MERDSGREGGAKRSERERAADCRTHFLLLLVVQAKWSRECCSGAGRIPRRGISRPVVTEICGESRTVRDEPANARGECSKRFTGKPDSLRLFFRKRKRKTRMCASVARLPSFLSNSNLSIRFVSIVVALGGLDFFYRECFHSNVSSFPSFASFPSISSVASSNSSFEVSTKNCPGLK